MRPKLHLLTPVLHQESGVRYYVDQSNGNDGNDGLSPADAWKTIAKVNGEAFNPGEQVLFRRGETWAETLTIPSSGDSDFQLVFGAYGGGAKPIIDGGSARANCIDVAGEDYITIQGIEVKDSTTINLDGNGDAVNLILKSVTSTGGAAQGIWLDSGGGIIENCIITGAGAWSLVIDTSGAYVISGTTFSAGEYGALVRGTSTGTMTDCVCHTINNQYGFSVGGGSWVLTDCTAYGITNVLATGFRAGGTATMTCIGCVAYDIAADGFDNRGTGTLTCRRCLSYNNGALGVENSGDGYTGHGGALVLEYCIAYGNTKAGVAVAGGDLTVYNCSFYDNDDGAGVGWTSNLGIGINTTGTVIIKNCITQGHEFEIYVNAASLPGLTLTCDYNCFYDSLGGDAFHYDGTDYDWADWKTQSGGDGNSLNENPLMVDPASQDFHLQIGSPCRNVGADVSLTEDYDLVSVPQETNPAMGAFEYVG